MCAESQENRVSYVYRKWPDERGRTLKFRLVYEGPLPSNGSPQEKHAIRKAFHGQLRELWNPQ